MSTKDALIAALQAYADGSGSDYLKRTFGSTGHKVELNDELLPTGAGYAIPGFLDGLLEVLAAGMDARGGVRPVCSWASVSQVTIAAPLGAPSAYTYVLQDGKPRTAAGALTWSPAGGVADGGLDAGVEQVATWYYLYLVPKAADDRLLAVRGSTSGPGTGPSGYTSYAYLGAWRNDVAGDLIKAHQVGPSFWWAAAREAFSGAGSDVAAQALSLAPYVPGSARACELELRYAIIGAGGVGTLLLWIDGMEAGSNPANASCVVPVTSEGGTAYGSAEPGLPLLGVTQQVHYQRSLGAGMVADARVLVRGWTDAYLL